MNLKYNRILLKLSGEALMGNAQYGIDAETVKFIASEIKPIYDLGVKIGIVIGGGNIFRGVSPAAKGWIELQQTIWVCLQQLLTALLCRMHLK